eukprot:365471-Chlamydomonas_euryale.AAC.18
MSLVESHSIARGWCRRTPHSCFSFALTARFAFGSTAHRGCTNKSTLWKQDSACASCAHRAVLHSCRDSCSAAARVPSVAGYRAAAAAAHAAPLAAALAAPRL